MPPKTIRCAACVKRNEMAAHEVAEAQRKYGDAKTVFGTQLEGRKFGNEQLTDHDLGYALGLDPWLNMLRCSSTFYSCPFHPDRMFADRIAEQRMKEAVASFKEARTSMADLRATE